MEGTFDSLLLGFSVAFRPDVPLVRIPWLPGRHAGRRPAGHRATCRHQHFAASDVRARRHQGRDHAGRHLLRLAIWGLDHLDPDAVSGRGVLGHDMHRRLRHGSERPSRRRALHRGGRILYRRHVRRPGPDPDRAPARGVRIAIRPARVHRAPGARAHFPGLHVIDRAAANLTDGGRRPSAGDYRH